MSAYRTLALLFVCAAACKTSKLDCATACAQYTENCGAMPDQCPSQCPDLPFSVVSCWAESQTCLQAQACLPGVEDAGQADASDMGMPDDLGPADEDALSDAAADAGPTDLPRDMGADAGPDGDAGHNDDAGTRDDGPEDVRQPTALCPAPIRTQAMDSLATAANISGRLVGAAVNQGALARDPTYTAVLRDEFNFATSESAMKWGQIEPTLGAPDYATVDAFVREACESDQTIRGHTLLWYYDLPQGLDALNAADLQTAVDTFITNTVTRYRGAVQQWDVVNEAIGDNSGFRPSVFYDRLGESHIAQAFRTARAADPLAELGYNDYGIIGPTDKSDRVYALVSGMVADGVPIDYVGFQAHVTALGVLGRDFTELQLADNLRRFTDLGLDVYITELDMRVRDIVSDANPAQREAYRRIVAACMGNVRCKGITLWGFTDRYSWIDGVFGEDDPLVFDESYARKPAYFGLVDGFLTQAGPGLPPACSSSPGNEIVCDGFEYSTGWATSENGGIVSFGTERRAGNFAMSAQVNVGAGNQAAFSRTLPQSYSDGTLYLKAHVQIPSGTAGGSVAFLGANANTAPFLGISVNVTNGLIGMYSTNAGAGATGSAFSQGSWHCVQLEVNIANSGSARLSLDGVMQASLTGVDLLPDGGFQGVGAGVIYSEAGGSHVLIDDVVISRNPTNCN